MMQVVVDVNIFVSAFLWGGTPERVLNILTHLQIPILWTTEIFDELETTLAKAKLAPQMNLVSKTPLQIVAEVRKKIILVHPYSDVTDSKLRDPKDLMILAAAVGGLASHVITGDKDLLYLVTYRDIAIVTATKFLELMNELDH